MRRLLRLGSEGAAQSAEEIEVQTCFAGGARIALMSFYVLGGLGLGL
jgi:hypothetical protein